jgi:hypothetical protein
MPPSKKKIITTPEIIENNNSLDNYFNLSSKPQSPQPPQSHLEIINNTNTTIITTTTNTTTTANNKREIMKIADIRDKIEQLTEHELMEIFKIIKNNNEKYSTNKNGIYVNLSVLKKNTIYDLSNFLYFCDSNNKRINNDELERELYKNIIDG